MTQLWFRRKTYGFGWFPLTWQGWAVIAGYVAAVLLLALRVQPSWSARQMTLELFVPIAVLVVTLVIICIKKGEKPRWQWGDPKI
jgi:hypothetical protein